MSFRQFVINNVIRNKRIYAAYFLSSMFSVMVFFTFAIFAFHPTFGEAGINSNALFGMSVAGGIIYVFSFFFVLYSMGSFLQSRKKEFGLLMIQGMSMRQIRFMVFLENMLIGIVATVAGILLGTVFAKLILLIAESALVIEETLYFYFPLWAMVVTFISFILLFLVISFFVTFILRSKKLAELIKADQQPKKEPKASIGLTIFALLLLLAGYATALLAKGVMVVYVMVPVIIVVIIGTYFLFTQLSVYLVQFFKNRKLFFWKKTNMILLSDLSFRMKDNARTFFMVAIISTVAFSAIGTLFGFQSYITGGIKEANPYTFNYYERAEDRESSTDTHETPLHFSPDEVEGSNESIKDIQMINKMLEKHNIKVGHVSAEMAYFITEDDSEVLIANESMYNEFANLLNKENIHLENNEIIGVKQSDALIDGHIKDDFVNQPVELKNGAKLTLTKVIDGVVLPELHGHYIVSDETYQYLPEPSRMEKNDVWKAANNQEEAVFEVSELLVNKLEPYNFQANDYMIYSINKAYGPVLFIGLFIGIVFFASAGSFLYFRLFIDLDEDKAKFASIAKIGLTDRELSKVITRQTAILFFAPIVIALIHGAVALTALSNLFDYNLIKESSIVLGSFLGIQILYYFIVRFIYTKQLKSAI